MIGIYAHHHGSGHLQRCRQIQSQLRNLGEEAVILSSADSADVVIEDDWMEPAQRPYGRAMTAGATLHYAPYANPGLRRRHTQIAAWIERNNPTAFYVDVSVEVAVLIRLMGVPVITIAMPGLRDDRPHQLAYAQADAIIAAWPSWVKVPEHLGAHASRLHAVGGISRLPPISGARRDPLHVVVMAGLGGSTWSPEDWEAVKSTCKDYRFTFLTGKNRVDDPTQLLSSAGVVVCAGGQNSIADLAVTQSPAIILPQPRPFIEQNLSARLLEQEGLAIVCESFPEAESWPELLERALELRPQWSRWETQGASARAARVIAQVAHRSHHSAIAIISLADARRAGHLANQLNLAPEGTDHITVALADAHVVRSLVPGSHVVEAPERNLALARNLGARTAIERGADTLIFLDADCIASHELVSRYVEALEVKPEAVVAGPVTYLNPGELRTVRPHPHPARPNPEIGDLVPADNYDLFWSLSFAVTARTWEQIDNAFGGFDPGFTGYGGEDTDFAHNLRFHGIELYWVGGAHAFHQWHPVSSPPWEHLDDIVTNANYFHAKWGRWPMLGWLEEFAAAGAIRRDNGTWQRT